MIWSLYSTSQSVHSLFFFRNLPNQLIVPFGISFSNLHLYSRYYCRAVLYQLIILHLPIHLLILILKLTNLSTIESGIQDIFQNSSVYNIQLLEAKALSTQQTTAYLFFEVRYSSQIQRKCMKHYQRLIQEPHKLLTAVTNTIIYNFTPFKLLSDPHQGLSGGLH